MKKIKFLVLLVIIELLVSGAEAAEAFDLIKIDISQATMPWWIHSNGKVVTQVWGILDYDWISLAGGPTVQIPRTKISYEMPVGIRLDVAKKNLPITHFITKVNFMGTIGPVGITLIHDLAWGRKGNPNVFYVCEDALYGNIGVRCESTKIGEAEWPAYIGPLFSYNFSPHKIQLSLGINARKPSEKTIKVSYFFAKP